MAGPIDDVIGKIADGRPIDWDAADALGHDAATRGLLSELRVIERLHDTHRRLPDDTPTRADDQSTKPPGNPAGRAATLTRWGRYRLIGPLGQGSFGDVYRARDEQLHRDLAIKLLRPGGPADDAVGPALLREAKDLARIRNGNVVAIYAVEEHEGQVGLCMELIEGRTLDAAVRLDGPLNADEATVAGLSVGRGLAAIHLAGLLHRDVKAKNVMRERAGRFVLMDLGAGLDVTDPVRLASERTTGTPLYMAPELFDGAAASVQSDIYSLGVLLYFLVTGRHPVEGETYEELRLAHARRQRVALGDRRVDLPDGFTRTVERALASDPAQRFRSANELTAALSAKPETDAEEGSRLLRSVGTVTAAATSALGFCGLIGFMTSTVYESGLNIVGRFAQGTGPLQWIAVGLKSLVAPVFLAAVLAIVLSVLEWLWRHVPIWPPPVRRLVRAVVAGLRSAAPDTLAMAVVFAQVVTIVAFAWWQQDLLAALWRFSASAPGSLEAMSPAHRDQHAEYRQAASMVVAVFAVAWYVVGRRLRFGSASLRVVAAGVGVTMATLFLWAAPYRVLWHPDGEKEAVRYDGQPCYLVSSWGGEVLLFCPLQIGGRNRIAASNDLKLQRTGVVQYMFCSFCPECGSCSPEARDGASDR